MSGPLVERLTIVGLGLIGGSVARGARAKGLAREIVAVGRREGPLRDARDQGIIDGWFTHPDKGVRDAELVLLATPVGTMEAIAREIAPCLDPRAVVTDGGSTKALVVETCEKILGGRFVGAHPMGGSEKSGFTASRADLFEGVHCFLTPTPRTDPDALKLVEGLWAALGARVTRMAPELHDRLLASVSHLPHLVAYALVSAVSEAEGNPMQYAAGGFRDTTRLAASDEVMWRDILLSNREGILAETDRFRQAVDRLVALVEKGDAEGLLQELRSIRGKRERLG